jgi:hypothetical protein
VPQIHALRQQGAVSIADVVQPSWDSRIAAGYPPQATLHGILSQTGALHEQYPIAPLEGRRQQPGSLVGDLGRLQQAEGRPVTPIDVDALHAGLDQSLPTPSAAANAAAIADAQAAVLRDVHAAGGRPYFLDSTAWAVHDPATGKLRLANGPEIRASKEAVARGEKPPTDGARQVTFQELYPERAAEMMGDNAPPSTPTRVDLPEEAGPKTRVETETPDHVTLDELRDAENAAKSAGLHKAVAGGHAGKAGAEGYDDKRQAGFWNNLESAYEDETAGMSPAQKALSVAAAPGAMFGHWVAGQASAGYEKAQSEPVYEHVNPQYAEPPGTVQDHIDVQNQLLDILQARAQSEIAAGVANHEEAKHKANQEPIKKGEKAAKDAMTATEAHKKGVERRQEANKKSADKETESKTTIDDYAARSAQLTAITGPLRLFERFTYLANYLPDEPQVLVGVKNSILKVHTDADKFLKALDNVDGSMKAQKTDQPRRAESIKNDGARLGETNDQAVNSGEKLDQTKKGAEVLGKENDANVETAGAMKKDAQNTAAALGAQADQTQAQAQSMAAAWQSWALRHRDARLVAMQATEDRMLKLGYADVKVSER